MTERESLETILAEVNAWRLANLDKLGTPEFERIDLGDEATPAQRAYVMKRLKELEG